jgi:hypothetical protein
VIGLFDYLEHKKRTSQLHVAFCEHGWMSCPQFRAPEESKFVGKVHNSSLNVSVEFQITLPEHSEEKLYLGPSFPTA